MSRILAHISEDRSRVQTIAEHAEGTAELARSFAEPFSADDAAYAMGLLHDCGKSSDRFQERLNGAPVHVDHSTAGTIEAVKLYQDPIMAACIAGHHAGLPDFGSRHSSHFRDSTLWGRLKAVVGKDIPDYAAYKDAVALPELPQRHHPQWVRDPHDVFFYTHMLYSCLVDADFLDTETFMRGEAADRGDYESLDVLNQKLDAVLECWRNPTSALNRKRTEILESLIAKSSAAPGLYTLTVPTGGGKTVSSMAFALKHALNHGKKRVIYVTSYQSIIEQTAKVFSDIFGKENVLAHYSSADFQSADESDEDANRKKLAAENWDAPIIVTTSVQFFESFFANRPSQCRKLHHVAESVLIFDEAQSLPIHVLRPCLYAISQLVKHYGCTAVLCTATQPALNRIFAEPLFLPGKAIPELCPDTKAMFAFFRRVRYEDEGGMDDGTLSERLENEHQALCIVNTIRHAQTLYEGTGGEGRFCLTTRLTPRDRRHKLDEIRQRLTDGLPCRVISTSLIEAGVDVDFPTVYRELAGLDSIIQAGGRCNRENRRPPENSVVHIFRSPDPAPKYIRKNIDAAERVLRDCDDPAAPDAVTQYFNFLLYVLKDASSLDESAVLERIPQNMPFAGIAQDFRIIDSGDCAVIVPHEQNRTLLDALREFGPSRSLLRRLGTDTVNLRRSEYQSLLDAGLLEEVGGNLAVLGRSDLYDSFTGLKTETELIF